MAEFSEGLAAQSLMQRLGKLMKSRSKKAMRPRNPSA